MSTVIAGPSDGNAIAYSMGGVPASYPWAGSAFFGLQALPDDQIGIYSLTLDNLVVGSAIRIELTSTGAHVAADVATATSITFSLPAYAGGSPLNNLRIKVRKGSAAPFYQPYETQATAFVGSQSVFVSQIPD